MLKKIIIILALFIIYTLFCVISKKVVKNIKEKNNKLSFSFWRQAIKGLILAGIVIYACTQFEATKEVYTSILTNASLIVVVLGFAAQESIKNVLSGIMIIKSKPFAVGQRIVLSEQNITGTIQDITLRHTIIQRYNNTTIIVPNSIMNNAIIENSAFNGDETIAGYLDMQISYESDIEKALEIIKTTVKKHPFFLENKEPFVSVRNLAAEGYDVRTSVWTKTLSENFRACSDLRIQLKKAFDENGIEIPYNHMNLLIPSKK